MTIDVEDWFQVENFKRWISFSSWDSYELRVERNIHRLLDLFDSAGDAHLDKPLSRPSYSYKSSYPNETYTNRSETSFIGSRPSIKATFFILGWIAKRLPHLVCEIHDRGHEVASHGFKHKLCHKSSLKGLKKDLSDNKKLLEDTIGYPVFGFRAPSFSINPSILKTIKDSGYLYDSSYNSFSLHGRYGKMDFSQYEKRGIALKISNSKDPKSKFFYELPISNFQLGNLIIPFGGGAYFRLIPFPLFKRVISIILKKEKAYLFYLHPWEIDPDQPRIKDAFWAYKFRHYTNLTKTYSKLSMLIDYFREYNYTNCYSYINSP